MREVYSPIQYPSGESRVPPQSALVTTLAAVAASVKVASFHPAPYLAAHRDCAWAPVKDPGMP